MTGEETFEFAAAIAGVSIGLAAALALAILAIVGVWRLFHAAAEAQQSAVKASTAVEEMARRLTLPATHSPGTSVLESPAGQGSDVQFQIESLVVQQRHLQEMARGLLDTAAVDTGGVSTELVDLEATVNRLDTTVGQMATSLANLIRLLQDQARRSQS